jgi:3-methyladenine DNA glycosylase/8-oxoguanine DNA glycosylase
MIRTTYLSRCASRSTHALGPPRDGGPADGTTVLLALPDPYDFALSTERFRAFGDDLVNRFQAGALYRFVAGRELAIAPAPGGVEVAGLDQASLPALERLLGLGFDLDAFARFAGADPVLGGIVERLRGLRPPLVPDPFESLVTTVIAQQVSLRSALAIRNRLVRRFGAAGTVAAAFPTRERIAAASEDELAACGFTRAKAACTVALARSELDLDALAAASDEEVRAALTAQRGLGPWSAEWFLARHLGRPHAWPAGDLVLRRAADSFYGCDVHELGRRLDPFQNLSAHYLLSASRTP